MIEIQNLQKRFGKFRAVKDLSLTIQRGEIFGLLGMNGAGKTTTLKILAGILRPTAGTVRLGGYDIERQGTEAKRITGFIPDRPYLYPKLTGREFLYFIADLYALSPKKTEERIDLLMSDYHLTEWENELVENYSHGMKQRLATIAALIHEPQILIVDEPMVGLDPHGAKLLKESLKRYAAQGITILLSTHSLNVAQELSDRLAIMHRGELITEGTFEEIRNQEGSQGSNLEEIFLALTTEAMNNPSESWCM